jgi:hypothetical protein
MYIAFNKHIDNTVLLQSFLQIEGMEGKLVAKYILYFFSYLLVYIAAFPILFILVMATDDPTVSHDWFNVKLLDHL